MAILYGTMPDGSLVRVQADSQGRLVAELANPVDSSNFVPITGATMTGPLTVPVLNGGQLAGFRNVLINGQVSINQRNVTYSAAAVGDYWADRWKKTASGMTQIVEAGAFAPSAEYTLSGNGVSTQQVTSPASGDWTIPDVPSTATNIQLEPGSVATPFEYRPIAIEMAVAQRYFQRLVLEGAVVCMGNDFYRTARIPQRLSQKMRITPIVRNLVKDPAALLTTQTGSTSTVAAPAAVSARSDDLIEVNTLATSGGLATLRYVDASVDLDAEL